MVKYAEEYFYGTGEEVAAILTRSPPPTKKKFHCHCSSTTYHFVTMTEEVEDVGITGITVRIAKTMNMKTL